MTKWSEKKSQAFKNAQEIARRLGLSAYVTFANIGKGYYASTDKPSDSSSACTQVEADGSITVIMGNIRP